MNQPSNSRTPSPKGEAAREARLAAALRANLKRRKAQERKAGAGAAPANGRGET